jgi:hypothetical protein
MGVGVVMANDTEKEAAYYQGYDAAKNNQWFLMGNPYLKSTHEWHSWRLGYCKYKEEEEKVRPRSLLHRWIDAYRD